ncbi:hypothetical protein HBI56_167740 [Parastagonospora nodorum]|nr:hypothetical protein HBI56_167740 [Parastagonospora nodorum]
MTGLTYACDLDERDEITQTNARNSPMLRLPAELRNQIYRYALAGGVAFILPKKFRFKGNPRTRFSKNAFGLRCVCRQLRAETYSIFYNSYTFDLTGFSNGHDATRELAWREISLIESIRIKQNEVLDMVRWGMAEESLHNPLLFWHARRSLRAVRRVEFDATEKMQTMYMVREVPKNLRIGFGKADLEVCINCMSA